MRIAILASYPAQCCNELRRLKPGFVSKKHHPSSWVRSLAIGLNAHSEIQIRVFTHSRAVSKTVHSNFEGIPFTILPKYEPARLGCIHFHIPAVLQFRNALSKYDPDIVHGFGTESSYGLASVLSGLPNIVTIQGIREKLAKFTHKTLLEKRISIFLEKYTVSKAKSVIARNCFSKKWALQIGGEKLIHIIPNAVNREFFSVKPDYNSKILLTVGTLNKTKSFDTAIDVLHKAQSGNLRLYMIGEGHESSHLKDYAHRLGLSDKVFFLGHQTRESIAKYLSNAMVLLVTSRMDTSPNVILEAHAAGLPVIATNTGGIPEMVIHNRDGFLFDVFDSRNAAKFVDSLSDNPVLCEKLGKAGREKVRQENSYDRITQAHIESYKATITL